MSKDNQTNGGTSAPLKDGKILWVNTLFLTITPVLAIVLGSWHLYAGKTNFTHIVAFFATWWMTGLGITMGYHRLFSHRSYNAPKVVQAILAFFGGGSIENSAIVWSAGHRYHHRDVDTEGDPYNAQRGFLYSHILWIMREGPRHNALDNVDDLFANPITAFQHKHYLKLTVLFNIGVPLSMGLITGDYIGMLLWAGLIRLVAVHHGTFCINSVTHMFGKRPYSSLTSARDNWLFSLITFGEGYHNYHHAFQTDYRNGPRWFNFDPGKWLIWSLSKVGLASGLRRIPDEMIIRKRLQERRYIFDGQKERLEEAIRNRLQGAEQTIAQWREEFNHRVKTADLNIDREIAKLRLRRKQLAVATSAKKKELKREFVAARASLKRSYQEWEASLEDALNNFSCQVAPAT